LKNLSEYEIYKNATAAVLNPVSTSGVFMTILNELITNEILRTRKMVATMDSCARHTFRTVE
jgi:hypothetical protein